MKIIPVIDLKAGQVVHAIAGERDHYQPMQSQLFPGCDPLEYILGFSQLGYEYVYVADLDGIVDAQPDYARLALLAAQSVPLLLDVGIRHVQDVETLIRVLRGWPAGWSLILASETLDSSAELDRIGRLNLPLVFSLDLHAGHPRLPPDTSSWDHDDSLLTRLEAIGCLDLIVLDTASVGASRGVPTLELCRTLKRRTPQFRLITGGGIRHQDDLDQLVQAGVQAALISTALHRRQVETSHPFMSGRADIVPVVPKDMQPRQRTQE